MELDHFSFFDENGPRLLQFSHLYGTYEKGRWNKESRISLDHYKLNIFDKGEFTVFSQDSIYEPGFADVFICEPLELHCGNIVKQTYVEYYQIDFSEDIFTSIPKGSDLLCCLLALKRKNQPFLRTGKDDKIILSSLCQNITALIETGNISLAYANIIRLFNSVIVAYKKGNCCKGSVLSGTVSKAIAAIKSRCGTKITVSGLASLCNVSESYLLRAFKKELGQSVSDYIMQSKIVASAEALSRASSVTSVAAEFGFSDASHYISCFKKYFACTPGEYIKSK